MPEVLLFLHLQYLHKNSPILVRFFVLMHADSTAVKIQSNKIVSNEVKRKLDAISAILQKIKRTLWSMKFLESFVIICSRGDQKEITYCP